MLVSGVVLMLLGGSSQAQTFSQREVDEIRQLDQEWATFPPVNNETCREAKQFAAYSLGSVRAALRQIRQHQDQAVQTYGTLQDPETRQRMLAGELEASDKWIESSVYVALGNVRQAKKQCLGNSR